MPITADPDKASDNFRKHGVLLSTEALAMFDDDFAITIADDSDPSEPRFVTIGLGAKGHLLVVAYCYRGDDIRLISARPAEPRERQEYGVQL